MTVKLINVFQLPPGLAGRVPPTRDENPAGIRPHGRLHRTPSSSMTSW